MVAVRALTAMLLRIVIIVFLIGAIVFGVRRIMIDWRERFRALDAEDAARRRARDQSERAAPGVIELKRDADGVYRPGDGPDDTGGTSDKSG